MMLWGAMRVAIPTAIPDEPLIRRLGTRREDSRLVEGLVEVLLHVDRIFVDVDEKVFGDLLHACLSITHCRCAIAVD